MTFQKVAGVAFNECEIRCRPSRPESNISYDRDRLFLRAGTSGCRVWQYQLRLGKRPTTITLGDYPYMTLRQARDARDPLRMQARAGEPILHRTSRRRPATFAEAATRGLKRQEKLCTPTHYAGVKPG